MVLVLSAGFPSTIVLMTLIRLLTRARGVVLTSSVSVRELRPDSVR